jgi:uncharacterized protein
MESYYVAKSKFGKGIFAARDIKIGELIMNFKGMIISGNELGKVAKKGRNALTDPLQVSDDRFMLILSPYVLVNHSCDPNSGLKNITKLVAIKNIKKGDEIFLDYSSVWLEGFRCRCGSRYCRGYISEFDSIPKLTQRRYIKLGIVPKFILNKIRIRNKLT